MTNIFSDLKGFGIEEINDVEIFKKEEKNQSNLDEMNKKHLMEEHIIYDGKVNCPVCENSITIRAIRGGKLRLLRTDLDLRPVYDILDPAKYDVLLCNRCGYAALKKVFHSITSYKAGVLKSKVAVTYIGKDYPPIYDYDVAIERYKLALYDAIIIDAKNSEKAYLCLKTAWLYRAKAEELKSNETNNAKEEILQKEIEFLRYAVEGFKRAYETEDFPTMGLDEITVQFLIGEISRRIGDNENAIRWLSDVIVSKAANKRLKERARESKELIKLAKSE